MSVRDFSLYDMLERNDRLHGKKKALVWEKEEVSFSELLTRVRRLAAGLKKLGIRKGDRIAILAQNRLDYFYIYGTAAALGVVTVPINWRLNPEEIRYVLQDSSPKVLFVDDQYTNLIPKLKDASPSLKHLFILGENDGDLPCEFKEGDVDRTVSADDPFIIIYTAAVKGRPMGAVLSHGNILANNLHQAALMGLTRDDVYVMYFPLFHIAAVAMAFAIMHCGGKNVIIPKFDSTIVIRLIEKERVSILNTFPPVMSELLSEMGKGKYDVSSLKHVMGLEDMKVVEECERKTGARFYAAYGQTETTGLVSICPVSEKPGSAGRPCSLVDLKIVDEMDREVKAGESGEITARGPVIFQGYWRNESATAHAFRGGRHHTGDMARLDEEGYLWFMGPKPEKDLIKSGGENVYPAEVEKVILEHPAVKEVAVIGVPDPKFGVGIKAVCVLRPGEKVTEEGLIAFVADRIARYKKPRYVTFTDSLPKKANGEVDREQVSKKFGGKE